MTTQQNTDTQNIPEFIAGAPLRELTLAERQELARLVQAPVFQKAWGNVLLGKPSVFQCAGAESGRLHELRGWELFREAFVLQLRGKPAPPLSLPAEWGPEP